MKHIVAILLVIVMAAVILSACGEKTDDTPEPVEMTVILETTADGGTVEQDAEGNVITKDKDGAVTSVKDKQGNPVDVEQYLTTHTWVASPASSGKSSGSDDDNSDKTAGQNSKGSTSGSKQNDDTSTKSQDDVEGEIPVIVATIPDDEDMVVLPDL